VTRHGTLDPQIAALVRSAMLLALNAAGAVYDGLDRHRRRPIQGKRHPQTHVSAQFLRILPPSPTAPASPNP